jgi:hypothetical protein
MSNGEKGLNGLGGGGGGVLEGEHRTFVAEERTVLYKEKWPVFNARLVCNA